MTNELAYEILKGIIGITETDVEEQGNEEGGVLTVECFKVALDALEKQIPKKPTIDGYFNLCPVCTCEVIFNLTDGGGFDYKCDYCPNCGTRIMWEDEP